jgi:superfamily II DNA or RNA helicase
MIQPALYDRNDIRLRPLWPHQERAIAEIRQAVREGHKRIIVQAPTGAGKTLTAAHLIAGAIEKGKRPLFTCPAITLVEQTLKSFENEGIYDIGIIQAQHERTDWNAQVQIASVQTLIRRALPDVDFILIDEAHENFDKLNERLDSDAWKDKIAIGLSATPWTKGMGLRWTKLIIVATIQDLIDDGFLSPFTVYVPDHDLDRGRIRVEKGEFQESSASSAMSDAVIVGDVVKTWKEHSHEFGGDKTFMFCVNRAHAKEQMGAFHENGIPFGYIDADTPMEERTRIFRQMSYGEIAGVASVGCLIRGVDEDVRCIIDAAPTKSETRHVQKIGRGLRRADGKERLYILDHAGNSLALGMVTDIHHDHLDKRNPKEKGEAYQGEKPAPKPKKCSKCKVLIPPKMRECPSCGTKVARNSGVGVREGELVVMSSSRNKSPKDEKQSFLDGLAWIANKRGFKPGWAAAVYREKFGVWPANGMKANPSYPIKAVRDFDSQRLAEWRKKQQSA